MAQMISTYTTDEQRRNHHATAGYASAATESPTTLKVQGGSEIEFF
jgi:hypothetical protein